ncbi:MAG: DctP family TRAP transporter solute-binding subunit [Selenomonadaceae bacterium]|nr:DctP family TRAP transporter solute-binding subunit [Selenomonadaceae bacterium]
MKMPMWRKILMSVLLMCSLLAFWGCGEQAADGPRKEGEYQKIKLVMSVNGTNIATDTKVAMKFAELMEKESGGNITIDVFPNDQLAGGNASKGIEMIADGAVDLAAYAAGVMAVMDEHLLIATIPWTFNNYQEAREIIDTTGGEYYKKILAQQGMTFLASAHNGFRQITNGKHPVMKPEDVAGLKIRVPGGEVYFKFWRAFGADPVAMSWSEAFTAIQQGTIDGQENGFSVTNSAKVNEIQQYMTVWNYTYENYLFVANTKIFENLEPKTQELIRAKAKEACEWGRDLVENDEENLRKKFEQGGMEVIVLTPEQLKPFQDKVQGVRQELMEKYGDEACKAFRMK